MQSSLITECTEGNVANVVTILRAEGQTAHQFFTKDRTALNRRNLFKIKDNHSSNLTLIYI